MEQAAKAKNPRDLLIHLSIFVNRSSQSSKVVYSLLAVEGFPVPFQFNRGSGAYSPFIMTGSTLGSPTTHKTLAAPGSHKPLGFFITSFTGKCSGLTPALTRKPRGFAYLLKSR
jgi:hypothetical protein